MSGSMDRPTLHVEGENDLFALVHLLTRNGIDYDAKPWPPNYPQFKAIGDVDSVLMGMETAVSVSNNRPIGFVIDADRPLESRWTDVRAELAKVGVDAPHRPPSDGLIVTAERYNARVGVWLMPDNQRDGSLEDFLQTLIDGADRLISHANASVQQARQLGAAFADKDLSKAVVYTWLAWQEEPGHPYGRAIRKQYFKDGSPTAEVFIRWFRALFAIG